MKTKIALFAAVLGVTGIIAGTQAFAHQSHGDRGHGNSYAINQCKNGGWKKLGYKNQGQCIKDMLKGDGNGSNPDGNHDNSQWKEFQKQLQKIFSDFARDLANLFKKFRF